MADRKHRVGLSGTPSLTREKIFQEAAGHDVPTAQEIVSSNAKAQLDARAMYEEARDKEEARWRAERQTLGTGSVPSPDLGTPPAPRDVQKEYTALKAASDQRKDAIVSEYNVRMGDIRANGATLTNAFNEEQRANAQASQEAPRPQGPQEPNASQDNPIPTTTPETNTAEPEQTLEMQPCTLAELQSDFARAAEPQDIPVHDHRPSLSRSR